MIQTMSRPNDWLQFYNQNLSTHTLTPSIPVSSTATAATVTPTEATTTTATTSQMLNSSSSASTHLSPEGRVSKATRRRSRASRRTPTTLLNTDTTNFRAMVQQFTGGPSAPFAPTPSSLISSSQQQGLQNLMGFGFAPRQNPPFNPTTLMVSPPRYHLQQQQQQQHLYPLQNQQQYMYSSTIQGGDNMFFQRLSNARPTNNVVTDHDEVLMDHEQEGRFFPNTSSS
ncbi:uncharacterized protein LOC133313917 [Gastrolobium bilobum]|uniref:uncharacterized protein LOC133313917 n=1 Tax=Gastrolobium bilobum TaxID=150636 RepID=UPI002AAF0EF1|nr:uncharacterized protein LOC133313917 [Gastrolobium bilobum]